MTKLLSKLVSIKPLGTKRATLVNDLNRRCVPAARSGRDRQAACANNCQSAIGALYIIIFHNLRATNA
jgi:hypothetical protein